jgi:DNA-binding transcriptional ArsR family regulator
MTERTWSSPHSEVSDAPKRFADDDFFRALSSQMRRRLLAFLLVNERCTTDDLVDVLCGWESVDTLIVPPECAEEVEIELFHVHLPLLEQAGLISYDDEAGDVALERLAEPVRAFIQGTVEAEHD